MKDDPAVPGSPLTSMPTWSNTLGCSTTSAFFVSRSANESDRRRGQFGPDFEAGVPSAALYTSWFVNSKE
jgi:hypothetical protein